MDFAGGQSMINFADFQTYYRDLLITKLHYIDCKIVLMACMVQNICFMDTIKSNYFNEMSGLSNNGPHIKR